jgi:hypothetical protein
MQVLYTSPGLENIWQIHWAYAAGLELNTPGLFIANLEDPAAIAALLERQAGGPTPQTGPPAAGRGPGGGGRGGHTGPAFWIKVSARADGSFTVTNPRNGFSKTYDAR